MSGASTRTHQAMAEETSRSRRPQKHYWPPTIETRTIRHCDVLNPVCHRRCLIHIRCTSSTVATESHVNIQENDVVRTIYIGEDAEAACTSGQAR